jgi:TctA family transporter
MTSMIKSNGNPVAFFERPVAAILGVITIAIWLAPLFLKWRRRAMAAAAE